MQLLPVLSASLLFAAAVLPASAASPLAGERWNKRVVLAFAGEAADGRLDRQIDGLLADREGLAERDMLVIAIAGKAISAPFGTVPPGLSADRLREAYDVVPETPFTVILIGKDGGEKLRQKEPVAAEAIFGLIDSMPMRLNEAAAN